MNNYIWKYGSYVDSNTDEVLNKSFILSKQRIANTRYVYDLYPDVVSENNPKTYETYGSSELSNEIQDKTRQYITLNIKTHIDSITVNLDIFQNLFFTENNAIKYLGEKDNKPYISVTTQYGEIINIDIEDCVVINNRLVIKPQNPIYYTESISFVGPKYSLVKNISSKASIIDDKYTIEILENIDTHIQKNDIFVLDPYMNYGNRYSYIEYISQNSINTDINNYQSVNISGSIYLYNRLKNTDTVDFAKPETINDGIYRLKNDKVYKILLITIKQLEDYLNIDTNAKVYSSATEAQDIFESIEIYQSNYVDLNYLQIQTTDQIPSPIITASPSVTPSQTPTLSITPTMTPTVSVTNSLSALVNQNIYTWGGNKNFHAIKDGFKKSDITSRYTNLYVGYNHIIVECIIQGKRVFLPVGDNDKYQLGIDISSPLGNLDTMSFTINNIFQDPYKISLGKEFSLAINREEKLFAWGDNTYGQLGTSNTYDNVLIDKNLVKFPRQIGDITATDIASGDEHSFVIDDKSRLLYAGKLRTKQSATFVEYFDREDLVNGWSKIFTKSNMAFGIRQNDNHLYMIYGNYQTVFLEGQNIISIDSDILNYKDISLSDSHLLIIKQDGRLWGFGNNDMYQLGRRTLDEAQNYVNYDGSVGWRPDTSPYLTPTVTSTPTQTSSATPTNSISLSVSNSPTISQSSSSNITPTPTTTSTTTATPTSSSVVDPTPTPTPTNIADIETDNVFIISNISDTAYSINGEPNPVLNLTRGRTYLFNVNSPGHPFYIKTQPTLGFEDRYTDNIDENGAAIGQIIFRVTEETPDKLYYISQFSSSMSNEIVISDVQTQSFNKLNTVSGFFTGVGTNGRSSYYGTYDQNGNIEEVVFNPLLLEENFTSIIGGYFGSPLSDLTEVNKTVRMNTRSFNVGFRLAASFDIMNYSYRLFNYDFVGISDNDNQRDTANNLGAVTYDYCISKYPVTNLDYARFLNYNKDMVYDYYLWEDMNSIYQGIFFDGSEYKCKTNMENKPINYLIMSNILRYINWLSNSLTNDYDHGILDTGVYELSTAFEVVSFGSDSADDDIASANSIMDLSDFWLLEKKTPSNLSGIQLWLPSIDEWYKAAYYNGKEQSYTRYATNTNEDPFPVLVVDSFGNSDNGGTLYSSKEKTIIIDKNKTWQSIAAGKDYSLAIDTENRLYGFGYNNDGSLLVGDDIIQSPSIISDGSWSKIKSYNNQNFGISSSNLNYDNGGTPMPTPSLSN